MANYLTIGIVNNELLMFPLETTTLKPAISMAVQRALKGKFAQVQTNRNFLKECGKSTKSQFINTSQIFCLHINIL